MYVTKIVTDLGNKIPYFEILPQGNVIEHTRTIAKHLSNWKEVVV